MSLQRIKPGPDQESVWDYPRPPRMEASNRHLVVSLGGVEIVNTTESFRILETSHPPTYYIPPHAVAMQYLEETGRSSFCEWKGEASYCSIRVGKTLARDAAWFYRQPREPYAALRDHIAIYAHLVDWCSVDGERVQAQKGDFYGGWITSHVVGPFKGAPGTWGW